jgi:DNA-binding IclR family transcriptional regulator
MGKVLLAGLSPEKLAAYFTKAKLDALTPHTITDRAVLMQQVEAARRDGYAISQEEVAPGVVGIAVPVHDGSGNVVASLAIGVPLNEGNTAQLVARHLDKLREASKAISAEVARVPGLSLSARV